VTITRWTTFDGRWIAEIEGRPASPDEELAPGESLVNLGGQWVVPGDEDEDGTISAISFDYTGLDSTGFADAIDEMGHAADVDEFREAMRGINGYSQNFIVADQGGSIRYSGYQGVPCRGYLERNEDGTWAPGADPNFLLDGTKYGAFEVPMAGGKNDEGPGAADPQKCLVPWAEYPGERDPEQGYLVNANNDPAGLSFDDDLSNDPWYIGGPWDIGVRADTIREELEAALDDGAADLDRMQAIQGNVRSRLGEWFAPALLGAISEGEKLNGDIDGQMTAAQERIAGLWSAESGAFTEVAERLEGWAERGFEARAGVDTFYLETLPTDGDDAVATMIFNAWIGAMMRLTWDDEGLPGVWRPGGNDGKIRALRTFLAGRGPGNPLGLASWNEETGESIFFDVLDTEVVETSDEVMLMALTEALDFLRSPPSGAGKGGFGTDDMTAWLWGLRHQVRFESILADFIDADSSYSFISDLFNIDTSLLPLADDIPQGDPRKGLKWFPRHGDQDAVDAGNPGLGGKEFSYGSGPVMRMVIALGGGTVEGRNVVPGGQSGLTDSPHFHDQLELWLANEALPMRFFPADVAEGATHREYLAPAP
jgi:penicillin amidase